MLKQIQAKLEAKFPGLPKVFLGLIAAQLAAKVTDESGIDQAITDYDNTVSIQTLATEFQKEGDRRVADAEKEWKKKNPTKTGKDGKTDDDLKDDPLKDKDDNELVKLVKGLAATVEGLKAEKTQSSMRSRAAEKLKEVPKAWWNKRAFPEKEEDFDQFIEDVQKDWKDFMQEQINSGLMNAEKPSGGEIGIIKPSGKEEADIEAWAKQGKEQTTAQNSSK